MIHGIGNSEESWNEVIKRLPDTIRVVTVDLLGFGKSPKPQWAMYNASTQARAVRKTLLQLGLFGKFHIVGHSLGSLVAIEMARRYPLVVSSLVLCSPPFYQLEDDSEPFAVTPDRVLKRIFKHATEHRDEFVELSSIARRYKLANPAFYVDDSNVDSYMATLETMIINQTALRDVSRLRLPIHILRGVFDILVIPTHLGKLKKARKNISLHTVAAGHEIVGLYTHAVSDKVAAIVKK
jgi:pimeloyl-ACP methyl ester carboxylesterase